MPLVLNNSARVITIINVVLVPGQPKDVPDEYMEHPQVQSYISYGDLAVVKEEAPVVAQKEPNVPHVSQTRSPTKAEMMRE